MSLELWRRKVHGRRKPKPIDVVTDPRYVGQNWQVVARDEGILIRPQSRAARVAWRDRRREVTADVVRRLG